MDPKQNNDKISYAKINNLEVINFYFGYFEVDRLEVTNYLEFYKFMF